MPEDTQSGQGPSQERASSPLARLLHDYQNCLPLTDDPSTKDQTLLLLSPIVPLPASQAGTAGDPFESVGKSLSEIYASVRHVPYFRDRGITGAHVAFIKRANLILLVVVDSIERGGGKLSLDLASLVSDACESRPLIVLACCDTDSIDDGDDEEEDEDVPHISDFFTVIHANGYSPVDLEAISSILLGNVSSLQSRPSLQALQPSIQRRAWDVQIWKAWDNKADLNELHQLWIKNTAPQLHLDIGAFGSILLREGYGKHYIVRDPTTNTILGFCASFTTFADRAGEVLIGSIAAVVVREECRRQGIGRVLHDEALSQLYKIRGVKRVQLGSTFPRLLYGVPKDLPHLGWFQRQGWVLDEQLYGSGRPMVDWLLWFNESPPLNLASAGLTFRSCEMTDAWEVASMVERISEKRHGFGWYDQYAKILDSSYIGDIVVGFEGTTLVATAITFVPGSGNPSAEDNLWPGSVSLDVGGVTCICIKGKCNHDSAAGLD